MAASQCPDCGATFRPGAATCPGCGMEWPDDPESAAIEKLDEVIVKVQHAVESKFDCNDQAISTDENSGGFLFTDPADGTTYELRISKFDPQAWLET
jgi:uncharacterized Zn finger protein (UPF0148 family)